MNLGLYLADIKPTDGGVYQYSLYLLRMLLNCNQVNKLTIFLNKEQEEAIEQYLANESNCQIEVDTVLCKESTIKNILRQISDFWITRYYLREKPRKSYIQLHNLFNPDRRFFNKFPLDLLHVPKQHAPVYRLKYPVIITMHDLQHLHYPEFFSPLQRVQKSLSYYISIQEADRIVVSYDHVKTDLEKFFCSSADKVSVCAVPLNNDWITKEPTDTITLKEKFKLPEVFILTPSSTWAHKNHIAVLHALHILKQDGLIVHWVATGHKTTFYKTIAEKIYELGLEEQVFFTGIVSDQELRGLYALTSLVVIPTKYEAGSGPLFEAIRYNIPVICSNVTSLPETIGNTDYVFNPDNYEEIAYKIRKALTEKEFVVESKANAERQLKHFNEIDYRSAFLETFDLATHTQMEKRLV